MNELYRGEGISQLVGEGVTTLELSKEERRTGVDCAGL